MSALYTLRYARDRIARWAMTTNSPLSCSSSGLAPTFVAAMSQAGWKHRLLILGLFITGAFFGIAGATWHWLKDISPVAITKPVDEIATNPAAWFVVLMFGVALALLRGHPALQSRSGIKELFGVVPSPQSTPDTSGPHDDTGTIENKLNIAILREDVNHLFESYNKQTGIIANIRHDILQLLEFLCNANNRDDA